MNERIIPVTVNIDRDELREWAGKHADSGHHGVAHVLYQAANEAEGLREQALREAAAKGWDAAVNAMRYEDGTPVTVINSINPYREGADDE